MWMDELAPLIAQAQDGDADAYGDLVRRFQDMAVGYAYSVLGDFHLAEDAAQEAFVEAYLNLSRVYGARAFPAWLRKIVFKHCDRIMRRKRVAVTTLEGAGEAVAAGASPAIDVEAKETRSQVLAALRTLPEGEREVATLFYIGAYSQKQVAVFLDVPESTVNNRLHAARGRLKKEIVNMTERDLRDRRPSKDEEFVQEVLQRTMSSKELRALETLHDDLSRSLSETITDVTGKKTEVVVGYADQTTYAEVVSALGYYPTCTYWFTMAPLPGRAFINVTTPTVYALLGDSAEDVRRLTSEEAYELWGRDRDLANRARALRQLTVEQIEEAHPAALRMLQDLESAWATQSIRLTDLEVTTNGPALAWAADEQLVPGGFLPPNAVVAIVGLEIRIEGYDPDDLIPAGPRLHYPPIMICYPLSTFDAIRPLMDLAKTTP